MPREPPPAVQLFFGRAFPKVPGRLTQVRQSRVPPPPGFLLAGRWLVVGLLAQVEDAEEAGEHGLAGLLRSQAGPQAPKQWQEALASHQQQASQEGAQKQQDQERGGHAALGALGSAGGRHTQQQGQQAGRQRASPPPPAALPSFLPSLPPPPSPRAA